MLLIQKKTKDDIVIMVKNRSFDHPDYKQLSNYHIIKSKLASGVWPLDYIDIIF